MSGPFFMMARIKEAFDVRNDNTVYVRSEVLGKRTKRERE